MTQEQAEQIPEVQEMVANPPDWLQEWSEQVGADLKDGLRENPSYIAFARENGTVYHTYTVSAPDPFVAPISACCSSGRRSRSRRSRAAGARTSTRSERGALEDRDMSTKAVTSEGSAVNEER